MNSVSTYSIRAFNPYKKYSDNTSYAPLDDVNGVDLVDSFIEYAESMKRDVFEVFEDKKIVMSFDSYQVTGKGRCVSGVINSGAYGVRGKLRDAKTGKLKYKKRAGDADVVERFFMLFCPPGKNEALLVLHNIKGDGIKTTLHKDFGGFFKKKSKLNLQVNPVTYEKAVEEWMEADVKEIRAIGFTAYSDRTDVFSGLGHKQAELVLKPERNKTMGKLGYFRKGKKTEAIEFLDSHSSDVKAVVEMHNRKRIFRIGGTRKNPVFRIELDDSVDVTDGVPDFAQMHIWVVGIINDLCKSIYPGQKVAICQVN